MISNIWSYLQGKSVKKMQYTKVLNLRFVQSQTIPNDNTRGFGLE